MARDEKIVALTAAMPDGTGFLSRWNNFLSAPLTSASLSSTV